MSSDLPVPVPLPIEVTTPQYFKTLKARNLGTAAPKAPGAPKQKKTKRSEEEEQQRRQEAKAKARERKRKWRQNPENVRKEREAKKSRVAAKRNQEKTPVLDFHPSHRRSQNHQQQSELHLGTSSLSHQRQYTRSTTPKRTSSERTKITQPSSLEQDRVNRKDREKIGTLPPDDRISHHPVYWSSYQPLPQYPVMSHIPSYGYMPMAIPPLYPFPGFFMDARMSMRPPPLPPTTAVAAAAVAAAASALAVVKGTSNLPDLDPLPPVPHPAPNFDDHWGMGYGRSYAGLHTHPLSAFISDGRPGGDPPPRFLLNVIEEEYEKQQGQLVRYYGQ
mmetsp:Transcript_17179/g.26837  ORF Transcript_17179/g.26837 Transcript_17179/m.26837 type:complete len:332 (-) Transcript_17179:130-1125(-)|eukprot:CAMPEP_0201529414 /NCGR_PEP_ID=MMETSP0161_2-20130828/41627_1 /ASSEMBLY_ACC=CAM_ASM_000251 /TAXON_ID=180227 /ORGANISM="Neoparamoeba aestuarina, Strain SoJaBio B1-5/56/2" /LENGTH=331 /DNA_ID=CAMNT_0047931199 /DNA_START=45 /DNA_END=1040 /DNA_ORIENTATION=-